MHLARHSFTDGGDSEVSGDGGGVGMAKSLSTSASGGRDIEVCGQIVILAPMVVVSVEGGGMVGSIPSGGETSSSIGSSSRSNSAIYSRDSAVGETTSGNGCSSARTHARPRPEVLVVSVALRGM
nr:hypothetical protein [Tanacetum cinerariifolium]